MTPLLCTLLSASVFIRRILLCRIESCALCFDSSSAQFIAIALLMIQNWQIFMLV